MKCDTLSVCSEDRTTWKVIHGGSFCCAFHSRRKKQQQQQNRTQFLMSICSVHVCYLLLCHCSHWNRLYIRLESPFDAYAHVRIARTLFTFLLATDFPLFDVILSLNNTLILHLNYYYFHNSRAVFFLFSDYVRRSVW